MRREKRRSARSGGRSIFILVFALITLPSTYCQAEGPRVAPDSGDFEIVYVDGRKGDDANPGGRELPVLTIARAVEMVTAGKAGVGTVRINPGTYVLTTHVPVDAEKTMPDKKIIIEAGLMPDDPSWRPELMPVILSTAPKGEIAEDFHFVAAFLINASHVAVRGLKFTGYAYPNTRYFPIARLNKSKTDLFVEQCLFVGNEDASHLQVGVIARGNRVMIDHCVFYNVRNSAVFWQDDGSGLKTGNGITNSIIYGATQSGVWTAWPDGDFTFRNNIVACCRYAWIKNADNASVYTIENCVVVGNQHYQALSGAVIVPQTFKVIEKNVVKTGKITLRPKDDVTHYPLPIDYLHVVPGTVGSEMGAGLFKKKK